MNSALIFSLGHALYPMNAGFEFHSSENTFAADTCDHFLEPPASASLTERIAGPSSVSWHNADTCETDPPRKVPLPRPRPGADFKDGALSSAASFGRSWT